MLRRSADLRYFGQAFEVRVPVAAGAFGPAAADAVGGSVPCRRTARLYGYDFRGDARQQVEWVNLRVTGIGPIRRPGDRHGSRPATGPRPRAGRPQRRSCSTRGADTADAAVYQRGRRCRPAT